MSTLLLAALVGIPLAWHLGVTAIVYYDSGRIPLERRKWTAITVLIPIFGFFMYLFERSELSYEPENDPYRGNNFNIHPSRADDAPLRSRGDDRLSPDDEAKADSEATSESESTFDRPD